MPKAARGRRAAGGSGDAFARGGHAIFKMKTDIGQHVLKNPGICDVICAKAALKQSDIVLEVGPGTGNLTVKILEKAKKVIAVELDPRMAAEVTKRVQGRPEANRLEVLLGDVCKMELPYFDVCISNTPYQISSPLTARLLAHQPPPRTCVLTYQLEFAQRLLATPASSLFSRLSLNTQMFAHVTHIMKIGRNNFKPPPAVESSVVRIVPKRPRPEISFEEWDGLLRIAFVRKNRTLRASFLGTQTIMDLLESNYRTWCAQNNIPIDDEPMLPAAGDVAMIQDEIDKVRSEQDDQEWGGFEDDDVDMKEDLGENDDGDDTLLNDNDKQDDIKIQNLPAHKNKRRKRGKVAELVREKVRRVLEDQTGLADNRARQCDEADFLKLLWAMNREGIHFS